MAESRWQIPQFLPSWTIKNKLVLQWLLQEWKPHLPNPHSTLTKGLGAYGAVTNKDVVSIAHEKSDYSDGGKKRGGRIKGE